MAHQTVAHRTASRTRVPAVYLESAQARDELYRRTLVIVVIAQVFGGAGFAAGVTTGALLAQDMLGSAALAGLAAALFTIGSAAAALVIGRLSQRYGRRTGLSAGFLTGALGALIVVLAAATASSALLLLGMLVYGAGIATSFQMRYAGTDLAAPNRRARAVSTVMVATTAGAVAGPNLVGWTGGIASNLGLPTLSGPFLLCGVAFLIAAGVLLVLLRPDPLQVAAAVAAAEQPPAAPTTEAASSRRPNRGVTIGATVMVLTQLAMVAIMTMTPVHMRAHGHSLADVGLVISIHLGAMFLPSLVTGVLVDKLGRVRMAVISGVTILVAGLLAGAAPPDSMVLLLIALTVLGVGWNIGLISGTAMVVDATPRAVRARMQGSVDLLVSLAGTSGGALSGVVVATAGYAALSIGGGVLALALIPVVAKWRPDPVPQL